MMMEECFPPPSFVYTYISTRKFNEAEIVAARVSERGERKEISVNDNDRLRMLMENIDSTLATTSLSLSLSCMYRVQYISIYRKREYYKLTRRNFRIVRDVSNWVCVCMCVGEKYEKRIRSSIFPQVNIGEIGFTLLWKAEKEKNKKWI